MAHTHAPTPRTVEHRYSSAKLCYGTPGNVHEWQTYTYEAGNALYDVIDAGEQGWIYRTNLQTTPPSVHHVLIARHFGLAEPVQHVAV